MSNHSEAADSDNLSLCIHCNATFKSKTSLDDHTIREHPGFIASVSCKIHECPCCTYKTTVKGSFDRHMLKHPETLSICVHCNATYKSKKNLDDHIIRKHPDFIESISSKIHECTHCTYKTTVKGHLTEHMVQHTETADIYKLRCIHCDETFKRRAGLDEHIIKKHPHLIATITSKIHECTYCAYQTVLKPHFARHMLKHPETADNYKLKICVHCNAKFKSKASLDNHTVREHPDFVASVSNKLHECAHCTYKTTLKSNFSKHMWKHSKALITCTHCEAKFKSKQKLDEHTLKKHPDLIASVSSKIHECIYCTYKTTRKDVFLRHMEDHPEAELRCLHCEATFKRKTGLDNHVIRKHPHFIASVSSKMHECTYCTYKTTMKSNFAKHLLKHRADKLMCTACNKQFRHKGKLDDHTIRKHPHLIASVTNKIHECSRCAFKTVIKATLAKHIKKHSHKLSKCIHCNAIYKHKIGLDDHILRQHPELIASVSSKMHECTHCAFKTVLKANLALHMLEHQADKRKCTVCNKAFRQKGKLDEHTVRKHPHLIASVTNKIHECTRCAFKTVMKASLARHVMKHPEIADSNKLIRCNHCNSTFKSKPALNDHIINRHPDFMASISSKIHQCKYCTYKTTWKSHFARHMLAHPETADSRKLSKCIRCNTEYKHKIGLDEHILRQHPELIASVSNKMHECTHCAFKTVFKDNLTVHMVEHHETADICKFSTCVHCNTTFIDKQALSDHILRKHPGSIGSVSRKYMNVHFVHLKLSQNLIQIVIC
nr:unnamed protein product [Callosobruchus analis]